MHLTPVQFSKTQTFRMLIQKWQPKLKKSIKSL